MLSSLRKWLCSHGNIVWRVPLPVLYNSRHSVQTSPELCQKVKITRMLEKMIKKGGKRKWQSFPLGTQGGQSVPGQRKTKVTEGHRRRAAQVGVVMYDYITGLMNSGELHPQLVNCAVEVSKVVVVPDFSSINVHWLASGTDEDVHTQKVLDSNAGKLREMLISLQTLGRVPKIQFVQDRSQAKINQLEELLKVADMGPDEDVKVIQEDGPAVTYGNTNHGHMRGYGKSRLNADFRKMSHLSNTEGVWGFPENTLSKASADWGISGGVNNDTGIQSKQPAADDTTLTNQNSKPVFPSSVEFRHDLYGVNRDELVSKVKSLKSKAKDRTFNLQPTEVENFSTFRKISGQGRKIIRNKSPKQSGDTIVDVVKNDEDWSKELLGIVDKDK